MRTVVVALTENGVKLALKIGKAMNSHIYINRRFEKYCDNGSVRAIETDFTEFTGSIFQKYDGIVFIMACGIVVRAIAPYIRSKASDPAVVVLDEKGKYVISLLSGHLGGANRLAGQVAGLTGGQAVITTSTDVNRVISFDTFALENGCVIENLEDLKYISSALVNGEKVGLYSDYSVDSIYSDDILPFDSSTNLEYAVAISNRTDLSINAKKVLYIRPKNIVIGLGCKRGTTKEKIEFAILDFLGKNRRSILSLKGIGTIALKKDEEGLLEFCRDYNLDLFIIDSEDIRKVEDQYTVSAFVKETTGVSSVAEPCAVLSGTNASLVCNKTLYEGITLAMAEEEKEFKYEHICNRD